MKKTKLETGSILQIPLPKDLGFAYAKYIDLSKINSSISFPDMIRVFNYRTENENYDLSLMKIHDYIIAPKLVSGLPPTIRKGFWKIIGKGELIDQDMDIPHFSRNEDWSEVDPDKQDKDKWYYCVDADSSKKIKSVFENVKHLTLLSAIGSGVLETEIAMAFLMKEGKNVEKYFELDEFYERMAFKRLKESLPYYELSVEVRDKAMGTG